MAGVVEIRNYQLKAGRGTEFHVLMQERCLPMLRDAGMEVLHAGPSADSCDMYVLMRGYASVADLQQSQDSFYGSAAWRQGPREAVLSCIENYISVVLDRSLMGG